MVKLFIVGYIEHRLPDGSIRPHTPRWHSEAETEAASSSLM